MRLRQLEMNRSRTSARAKSPRLGVYAPAIYVPECVRVKCGVRRDQSWVRLKTGWSNQAAECSAGPCAQRICATHRWWRYISVMQPLDVPGDTDG